MSYNPFTEDDNSRSSNLHRNNKSNKGNTEFNHYNTANVSKFRSNSEISKSFRTNYPRSSQFSHHRNRYRGSKPNNRYRNNNRNDYKDNKYHGEGRSSNDQREFIRKHHYKNFKAYHKRHSSETKTTEVDVFDNNLLDSLVSTNSFIQEETVNWSDNEEENVQEINIKAEVIDSLTKLPVNISSNDQICIKNEKVNVLHLPMPPSSTNSFDFPLPPSSTSSYETPRSPGTDLRKIPIPTETAREKIKPGESFFKDNNYRNIIASEIFSPATKERPSKIVPKRPSVIKSTPTIDYPNRDLNEFNKLLKVGEGSYGTVYKAFDTISNELVAMKRVRMEHEHEGFPITAVREIKILRQLSHKNVVNLREIISHQKDIYLVFEYMNHDLMGLLENEYVCFNEQSIFCIIKQILEGLQYCHSKNFLHRDLKCSNILLNNKGEVKLGDFGLSRFYNAAFPGRPYTNKVISLWYRPIELLLGEESYGFEIDIWSCGCILAELFSRRPLFRANSELKLIEVISNLCGTPSTADWPEVEKLPLYRTLTMIPKTSKLLHVYKQVIPDLALLLLDQMLKLNPMKRITASEALQSSWIISNDKISSTSAPLNLPSWIDCHELNAKMKNKDKRQNFRKVI